ncbi:MAG: DUF3153 domain-containing protein [Cyanobacteriota bacterium]
MVLDPLAQARPLLERGEYGKVLRLLEPLLPDHAPASAIGARMRLLMATALMGQGHTDRAADCCRSLRACVDPELRAQARDLLMVLEAPELQRPREWSLTMPELAIGQSLEGTATPLRRRRAPGPPPPPPLPVGPTRTPFGFVALAGVLLVLLLLASLLGGCLDVHSQVRFEGPGRLQVSHLVQSSSGRTTPWQRRFAAALQSSTPFRSAGSASEGQRLQTPVLPAREALQALGRSLELAASLADQPLPPPRLEWKETNWLLGVQQQLLLEFDLTTVPALPGVDVSLQLSPLRPAAVKRAEPPPRFAEPTASGSSGAAGQAIVWAPQPGRVNRLELRCWRWSGLGLGAVAIALALALVLLLQTLRRRLGFGLPELPA